MARVEQLRAFVSVSEEGAFNSAARRLGVSPASVTRMIAALEADLGVQLFVRSTRKVATTEAGRRLHADAVRILGDLAEAEAAASGADLIPRGTLRITAPVEFGQRHIMPVVSEYLSAYPAVQVETVFVDRIVNLIDEGIDVAVRIGELADSAMLARKTVTVRRVVVASPAYLEHAGRPETLADLRDHAIVSASGLQQHDHWRFHRKGKAQTVRVTPRLRVNTIAAALRAIELGQGLARTLSYQVAGELADGRLVEVLPDLDDQRVPVHLIHAGGATVPAKSRAFLDLAFTRVRQALSGD